MVSEEAMIKFKNLYFRKYGMELSDAEATEQATAFLILMRTILQPCYSH